MSSEQSSVAPVAESLGPTSGRITIEAVGLARHYGDLVAVRDLNLHAVEGEILGFLGPNGAGKTSAIRVLTTILAPTSGDFAIAGISHTRPCDIRRRIGVLPESAGYPARQTGREYLRYHARLFGHTKVSAAEVTERLLGEVGLAGRAGDLVGGYSRGMRQRLGIARALVNEPVVVFLDEPTLGLDPAGQAEVVDLIRRMAGERGVTVLLSTHLLAEVEEVCTRVVILNRGRVVVEGTVADVIRTASSARCALVRVPSNQWSAAFDALNSLSGARMVPGGGRIPGELRVSLGQSGRADDALRLLLARDITVTSFELEGARLSDAFLAVTGGE